MPKDLTVEIPRRAKDIVVTDNGTALTISSPVTGTFLFSNKVGGKILDLVDGKRTVESICNALAVEFQGVDRSRLRDHVIAFLIQGEKKRIISFAPSTTSELPVLNSSSRMRASEQDAERERKFHPDIYWYLTFRCNLACTHCSVLSSPYVDTSADLKTAECLDVVEQLVEMDLGMAMLSGGEVLIRPDALTIIRALGDKGILVGVETNGIKIGEKPFIELALEMQSRNLLNITISLDGGTAETHSVLRGPGSFERTVRGMRQLHQHGVKFDIQCVLNRNNYKTIPALYDLAVELEPEKLHWSPLNSSGRGKELIKKIGLGYSETVEILDLIDQNKGRFSGINTVKYPPAMIPPNHMLKVFQGQDLGCCNSCKFPLLGILPNGDINVCGVTRENSTLFFGNVRDTRLKTAWEKARMDLLRTSYVGAEDLRGICGDCVWKYQCKGSCRAKAYEEGGDFFAPYPVCQEAAERGEFPEVYRISKGGYVAHS
jgi:radical SAM protein with 4Fe4S-binding SPASM domain